MDNVRVGPDDEKLGKTPQRKPACPACRGRVEVIVSRPKSRHVKSLIAEDDATSSKILERILKEYGPVTLATNGSEAVQALRTALEADDPYELVCLDIMMPEVDGHAVLASIRQMEQERGIEPQRRSKVIMTTALADKDSVIKAAQQRCDGYFVKPYSRAKLLQEMRRLKLNPPLGIWDVEG